MKKIVKKIKKNTLELSKYVASKDYKDLNESDVDDLAECIELLNDMYEELYDKIFEDSETICKGTSDQL